MHCRFFRRRRLPPVWPTDRNRTSQVSGSYQTPLPIRCYPLVGHCLRDAMPARVLAMTLCLSVCLSVTSRSSIDKVERIELVVGTGASFHPSYTVLKRNSGVSKIRVLPSGTLSQTPHLENFNFGPSMDETCCRSVPEPYARQSSIGYLFYLLTY